MGLLRGRSSSREEVMFIIPRLSSFLEIIYEGYNFLYRNFHQFTKSQFYQICLISGRDKLQEHYSELYLINGCGNVVKKVIE